MEAAANAAAVLRFERDALGRGVAPDTGEADRYTQHFTYNKAFARSRSPMIYGVPRTTPTTATAG